MNNKVIYRHLKPNGEVFYIGYGSKERAFHKNNRNNHWKNIVKKYGYEVQILKSNLTKKEAIELEIMLISYYGRIDLGTGILCNQTNGGDGGNNIIHHSDETKRKISKSNTGKKASKETLLKLSNSHKGKTLSKESIKKRTIANILSLKYKKGSSIYKGVCWSKSKNKWRATIYYNNKQTHLGYFENEIDAHYKYEEFLNKKFLEINK